VREGLLFNRVDLQRGHITPRDAQFAAFVIAHLADPPPAWLDQAAVGAGITAQRAIFKLFIQLAWRCVSIETLREV
jgi:hypothetical protein